MTVTVGLDHRTELCPTGQLGRQAGAVGAHCAVVDPGVTEEERRTIVEMMAKGTFAMMTMASKDLDATFEQVRAAGAEIVQEPTDQPWGTRDCAVRDPSGNLVRIDQQA